MKGKTEDVVPCTISRSYGRSLEQENKQVQVKFSCCLRSCLHLVLQYVLDDQVTSGHPRHITIYTCQSCVVWLSALLLLERRLILYIQAQQSVEFTKDGVKKFVGR